MPEGPEVKIMSDNLNQKFKGKKIISLSEWDGRYLNHKPISLSSHVEEVNCKGKLLYWNLQDKYIVNTLGMTGFWSLVPDKHQVVKLSFEDGSFAYFNDIRHFGTIKIMSKNQFFDKLETLGPDMLSSPPDDFEWIKILAKRSNKNICQALMDQKSFSGIGNYIKSEALYRAKISPKSMVKSIPTNNLIQLKKHIINVMQESYLNQGNSFKDYKTLEGDKGDFSNFLKVYKKDKDPFNNPVIREETPDKRTSWWVKEVQINY